MATENIKIGIDVVSNTDAQTTKALKLKKAFEEAAKAAGKVASTAGSRSAASIAAPKASATEAGAMAQATVMPPARSAPKPKTSAAGLSGQEYGTAQAVGGGSARDFAKESQGLGGLVRLYATFAANLFAASAAFTGLKNAADTTNLVKGLDTLGAVSGQALGSLSKRLVEVTDGAVSMREAMTATAQASSAGMSGKNIERLALVAKNASLALGVAMPDALSRLSRGIVKLEPELLDELGLFTKIGPATEKYALEIGKSAGALTDFERRQAFANAVLEEGEKKFGALSEAAANPYDKLLANLKNVLQSGGELINKVLIPVVSLLASSPTALAGVLAGIGYVLLKQALPAVGQLREGLKSTAEQALASSQAFKESFGDEFQTILEKRFKIPDLEAGVKKAQADLNKLKVPQKLAPSVQKLGAGEETNIAAVNKVLKNKNDLVESGMKGNKQASEAQIAAAKQEIAYINAAIKAYEAKQALQQGRTGTEAVADRPVGRFDPEVIALQKYDKLRNKVDQANAISNAAQVAQVAGVRASWGLLNKEIADKGITGFAKFSTLAQGGLAAVGTRVMGVVGSLGYIGQAVAIVGVAFALLDGIFSKNAKQVETFNKAITTSEESVANVFRTLQAATDSEGFATNTIANTIALSNAFNELTSSAKEALKTEKLAAESAGGWDKFWDSVFSIAGKDRASKLADTVAKQISSSIDILSREGLADEYATEIKKILNVDNLKDIGAVAEAWKNLSKDQQAAVNAIQENANRALGNTSSILQGFKEKTDTALTAYKTFTNSFIDTSPLFKLGEAYMGISQNLQEVSDAGPNRIAQAFEELAVNMQKSALYGEAFVKSFVPIAAEFKKQKDVVDALNSSLDTQVKARDALADKSKTGITSSQSGDSYNKNQENIEKADIVIKLIQSARDAGVSTLNATGEKAVKLVKTAVDDSAKNGSNLINRAIANARAAANAGISKVISSVLTGPRKLEADDRIRQSELKIQLEELNISKNLVDIQSVLVNEMKLANALQAEANIQQKKDATDQQKTDAAKNTFKARADAGQTGDDIPDNIKQEAKATKEQGDKLRSQSFIAKETAIRGAMKESTLTKNIQMPVAQQEDKKELAQITSRVLESERSRLEVTTQIASVTNSTSVKLKQAADAILVENNQKQQLGDITAKITAAETAAANAKNKSDKDAANAEVNLLKTIKLETEKAQKAENDNTGLKNRQELLNEEINYISKRAELATQQRDLDNTIASGKLEYQSQELDLLASTYGLSQQVVISRRAELDTQKSQLQTSTAIASAQADFQTKREEADKRIEALGGRDTTDTAAQRNIDAIDEELARQETLFGVTREKLLEEGSQRLVLIDRAKQLNLEQERYNQLLEATNSFAQNLSSVFGEVGSSLGTIVSAMVDMATQSERNNKLLADNAAAQALIDKTVDPESGELTAENQKKLNDLKQEEISLNEKSGKSTLSNTSKIAGATKSLFKEKTVAYKTFAAIEKATQLAGLALELKVMAGKFAAWWSAIPVKASSEAALTGIEAGGAAARAPLTYAEIIGQYLKSIPAPFGMIAGVAAGALFLSLLGQSGGKKAAFVPTGEQRQETQGTAMGYNSEGKKVQVRRGVFGDTDAKSEGIANSLEIIKDNSVDGLSYDNRMLALLTSIDSGIKETAKGLYRIPGLRTGSMFGTKTSRSIRDSGLVIEGTFAQLASDTNKSVLDFYEEVTVKKKKFLGKTKTSIQTNRKEVDDVTSEFFQDIFSNATELFIEVGSKAGIGEQAINEILGSLDVGKSFNSLRGLKGEDFEKELSSIVGSILSDAALVIFTEFEEFANFGEDMLETAIRVIDTNDKVRQQIKNTIGKDIDATLSQKGVVLEYKEAVKFNLDLIDKATNKELQDAAKLLGKQTLPLNLLNFGDDNQPTGKYSEMVRKANTSALSDLSQEDTKKLYDAGFSFASKTVTVINDGITTRFDAEAVKDVSYEITEHLAKLAGGLQNFLDQSNYFRENFLTEAERLAPIQESVTEQLSKMGYASVDTKEEFKTLVRGLDLTDANARKTYQSLMELAPGFIAIIDAQEKAKKELQKAEDTWNNFFDKFASAPAKASKNLGEINTVFSKFGLQLPKTKTQLFSLVEGLRKNAPETADAIIAISDSLSTYYNSAESFEAVTISLSNSLKTTTDTLRSQIKTLKDYNTSLLLGSQSTLNDSQKYTVAKTKVQEAVALIQSTGTSPEETKARNDAISSFSTVSDNFLKLSTTMFASGAQYQNDFNSIRSVIDTTTSALEDQLTDAELQLGQLTKSNTFLEDISKATKTTSDYLAAYLAAGGIPISTPSFAVGTNYVPYDMMAQIHKGERIIPAADNAELMQNSTASKTTGKQLLDQTNSLTKQIKFLGITIGSSVRNTVNTEDSLTKQVKAFGITIGSSVRNKVNTEDSLTENTKLAQQVKDLTTNVLKKAFGIEFKNISKIKENSSLAEETSTSNRKLSIEQTQLSELTKSTSLLEDVSLAAKTTNDYLETYIKAYNNLNGTTASARSDFVAYAIDRAISAQTLENQSVVTAIDNTAVIQNNTNNTKNNEKTQQLINQIVNLTKQVEELAAIVADGAILNAKATDRNTQEITRVISSTNDKALQYNRLQAKAGIK